MPGRHARLPLMVPDWRRLTPWRGGLLAMALTLAAGVALWFGLSPGSSLGGMRVTARFTDVTGLPRDGVVQLGGVPVGRVVNLSWREGAAEVAMVLDRRLALPRDTEAVLRARSLLGERFIDLRPGARPDQPLREGDRLERTRRTPDLDSLLGALPAASVEGLAEGVTGTVVEMRQLVRRLDATLDRVDRTLAVVERLSVETGKDVGTLRQMAEELRPALQGTLRDTGRAARTLDRVLDREVAAFLAEGTRTVHRLDKLSLRLDGTLVRLDPVLDQAKEVVDPDYLRRLFREEGVRVHVAPFR